MIGIILAAGRGQRLSRDVDLEMIGPKCLLTINGYTLLERMVSDLMSSNVDTINIVVGYKAEAVQEVCTTLSKKYGASFNLVNNNDYLSTNTAYSLNIGLDNIDNEDVVIFNGDTLYDYNILNNLLKISQTVISVDNKKALTDESFKLRIVNNQIEAIGKTLTIENATGSLSASQRSLGISRKQKAVKNVNLR